MTKSKIEMSFLVILIFFHSFTTSETSYLKRKLKPSTDISKYKQNRSLTLSRSPEHFDESDLNNEHNNIALVNARIYAENQRYPHRHKRLYSSIQNRFLPGRDRYNSHLFKQRRNTDLFDKRLDSFDVETKGLSSGDHSSIFDSFGGNNKLVNAYRKERNMPYDSRSANLANKQTSKNHGTKTNQLDNSDKASKIKRNKKDLTKYPSGISSEIFYRFLIRFDLLWVLVLFFVFVFIASTVFVIMSVVYVCKSSKKKQDHVNQHDLKRVTVKKSFSKNNHAKTKHFKKFKSMKDNVGKFNENHDKAGIEPNGRKFEGWITNDNNLKPQTYSNRPRNHADDMESVAEESYEIESDLIPSEIIPIEREESDEVLEDLLPLSDRKKKNEKAEKSKANKQESEPFKFPDEDVTIAGVLNYKLSNSRNFLGLTHQPGYYDEHMTQSMIEIIS